MSGEGDYPPPRAIVGILTGERLANDLSSVIFEILVDEETMLKTDDVPVLGAEVTIS